MTALILHVGHTFSWRAWHLEVPIVAGCLFALALYCFGMAIRPDQEDMVSPRLRTASFLTGLFGIYLALGSPIDIAAGQLLSMHMVQHALLTAISPPLVLLGLPPHMARRLFGLPLAGGLLRFVTSPLVAGPAFILNTWLWHLPYFYGAALEQSKIHELMHMTFLATGLLFWWPVINPLPEMTRTKGGTRLLYLMLSTMPMDFIAVSLVASSSVVYSYYETIPRLWGISAMTDQQLGAIVMGGIGGIITFVAFTLLFVRVLSDEEPAPVGGKP